MKTKLIGGAFFLFMLLNVGCKSSNNSMGNEDTLGNENSSAVHSNPMGSSSSQSLSNPISSLEDSDESISNEPGSVIAKTGSYVYANNQKLGILLAGYSTQLHILNDDGYMYNIGWDGKFSSPNILFELFYQDSCKGTKVLVSYGTGYYGKTIFIVEDQFYIPKNIDSEGLAVQLDGSLFKSYKSFISETCVPSAPNSTYTELKPITRAQAGIPANISPPIQIKAD